MMMMQTFSQLDAEGILLSHQSSYIYMHALLALQNATTVALLSESS